MRQGVFRTLFPAVPGDRFLTAGIGPFAPIYASLSGAWRAGAIVEQQRGNSVGTAWEQRRNSKRNSKTAASGTAGLPLFRGGTAAPDGEDYST
jgi:hypothetical protein